MRNNRVPAVFWPELPSGRWDIDRVHELLLDWAGWSEMGHEAAEMNGDLFAYSVVQTLECALILWLAPYAQSRGFDSEIFRDSNELDHALSDHVFARGYPLEMAQALRTCYSLEQPWAIAPAWAEKYVDDLALQLKNIALYELDASPFWKKELDETREKLDAIHQRNADRTKKATETKREASLIPDIEAWFAAQEKAGENIMDRSISSKAAEEFNVTQAYIRKIRSRYFEAKSKKTATSV